jgi:N-acetylglucosamine kinase-like BadF-type ATPase
VGADGALLARVIGSTISHQAVGLAQGIANLAEIAGSLATNAGLAEAPGPLARFGSFCLAGADSAADIRRLRAAIGHLGLVDRLDVRNDTEAVLRAGTPEGWGVAVVSGSGINAIGRTPDGRVARFAGLGDLSGDRGGGGAAGTLALGAAVSAQERRGPRTALESIVPAFFGLRRPLDVAFAIDQGRIPRKQLRDLSPLVFEAANAGDDVARGIVSVMADEAIAYAGAAMVRLRLTRAAVPVVLAGGTFRTTYPGFLERIRAGILQRAPGARISTLDAPPVLGAALIGLDALAAGPATLAQRRITDALRTR